MKAVYEQRGFNNLFPYLLFFKTSLRISTTYQLLLTLWRMVSIALVLGAGRTGGLLGKLKS